MLPISKIRLLFYFQLLNQFKRKSSIQGLTLIELLIVIIILGLLATITSTFFLNAVTRAKEAEAPVKVGALLREQQTYYLEHGRFAHHLDDLGGGVPNQTHHYAYTVKPIDIDNIDIDGNQITEAAVANAEPLDELRGYMGKTWLDPREVNGDPTTRMVVCKGDVGAVDFMDTRTYCP